MVSSVTSERWRALLALVLLVPVPTLAVAAALIWWPDRTMGRLLFGTGKLWLLVFPLLWHLGAENGWLSFSWPRRGGMGIGFLLGLAMAAIIVGGYVAVGREWLETEKLRDVVRDLGMGTRGRFLAASVYWIVLNALVEEYVWRWFVFSQAERLAGPVVGALLSAAFFTAHHVLVLNAYLPRTPALLCSGGVFLAGLVWCGCYGRYRSVWPGYVSHVLADAAIFAVGWTVLFR